MTHSTYIFFCSLLFLGACGSPQAQQASAEPSSGEVATTPTPEDDSPVSAAPAESEALTIAAEESDDPGRLTFSAIYRLAASLSLRRPTIHGRPTDVGENKYVALVSFPSETGEDSADRLRPEIWLIDRTPDGEAERLSNLPISHVPDDYLALSVGEIAEQATQLFNVRATRAGDFDGDGHAEFELVVEVSDEVVCGLGLLTHRWYMIYNVEPELSLAADIALTESFYRGTLSRATARLVDHNDDGHPDIDVRAKECTDGTYIEGEGGCRTERATHTYHLWDAESDRWTMAGDGAAPCDGGEE